MPIDAHPHGTARRQKYASPQFGFPRLPVTPEAHEPLAAIVAVPVMGKELIYGISDDAE